MITQKVTIAAVRAQQQALLAQIDAVGDRAHVPLVTATDDYVAAMLSARLLIQTVSTQMLAVVRFTGECQKLSEPLAVHLDGINKLVEQSLLACEALLSKAAKSLQDEQNNRYQPGLYRVEYNAPAHYRRGPYMVRAVSCNDARRAALAVASGRHDSEVSLTLNAEQFADFPMGVLVQAE